ncbi:MAG: aryl-sulfate sulfotransferase [Sphingomonadales bacterium]|jgi:predicted DNA-binding ribbon-helix-helix protein|nr:aryl-sulfate sulfotransferase [Sphingomonadales bacterium]
MAAGGQQGAVAYRSPVKHSVTIAGHETAITLEPIFWTALREAAQAQSLPLNALVARIDVERIATADPPNLASAIRQWLMAAAQTTRAAIESPTSQP